MCSSSGTGKSHLTTKHGAEVIDDPFPRRSPLTARSRHRTPWSRPRFRPRGPSTPPTGPETRARILRPMASRPYLSVVIPVFNEKDNVAPLHRELTATLEPTGPPYDVLFAV